ncbi:hypothetical protein [Desulfocastanea catecholica]
MNRQFYEFWGKYFTSVAQGQKQLEDMSAWMKHGFAGTDDLTALFRRCYGLNTAEPGGALDEQTWQKAIDDFQQTFMQLAEQWGLVSKTEHQKILDKCAALEKKVAQQQTTITQLRNLLNQEGRGHAELFELFKGTLEEQSNKFTALMESISKVGKDKT